MGKKRRILVAALLVVLLGGFAWWLLHPNEPFYNGKPLSVWLDIYGLSGTYEPGRDEALRHIGTNAIPTLLQMLRAKDSPLKTKCIQFLNSQHLVRIKILPASLKNNEAFFAFAVLRADAKNAVPDLTQIYDEKISLESQISTAVSIGAIGPDAKSAIPSLLRGLTSTNERVRYSAIFALGEIHGEPETVVPELVKFLHDSNPSVSKSAVEALGKYGTNAELAVPDLTVMLNDRNPEIRVPATNALKHIDPEAAAKAGVK
jgi:HEAT repeat protein